MCCWAAGLYPAHTWQPVLQDVGSWVRCALAQQDPYPRKSVMNAVSLVRSNLDCTTASVRSKVILQLAAAVFWLWGQLKDPARASCSRPD